MKYSLATYVYNQRGDLERFLLELEKIGFRDELLVVVIGGEDPYDLLEMERSFSVKAFYLEKQLCEHSEKLAIKIAKAHAQGQQCFLLDVRSPSIDGLR